MIQFSAPSVSGRRRRGRMARVASDPEQVGQGQLEQDRHLHHDFGLQNVAQFGRGQRH